MRGAGRAWVFGLGAFLFASPAPAERVGVRLGEHPGHGRVVLDLASSGLPYRIEEEAGQALVRLGSQTELDLPAPRRPPRNIQGLSAEPDGLRIAIRPGARLRHFRLGNRVVVDVLDPSLASTARVPPPEVVAAHARARRMRPERPQPAPGDARAASPVPALVAPSAPAAFTAMSLPPPAQVAPRPPAVAVDLAVSGAMPVRSVRTLAGRALSLTLPPETGLAVLRRGDMLLVVLDQPHPLDLGPLRNDPVFGGADAVTTVEATILSLRIAAPAVLRPRREAGQWLLEAAREPDRQRSILAEAEEGRLILRVGGPGRPVPIVDPETGLPLLVGTVREAGQAFATSRSLPQVELLPTALGVAALARADSAALRRSGDRFILSGIGHGVLSGKDPAADAAGLTRIFDFPRLDASAAQERLRAQQAAIGATPHLARLPLRREAAEGLLALGLAQEAQAMLRLSFQEDPRAAGDPRSLAAHAVAALLAGRPTEAKALADAGLPQSDELTLWRAALTASTGNGAEAAPGFAAALPLLLSYPDPLRAHLLPLAAVALLDGEEVAAARRLLRAADGQPTLAYARARLAEAEGRLQEALALYGAVAEGRDRLARARALQRSVEMRLSAGTLDPPGAAAALEAALFAWRGDAEEFATRLRIAELRQAAGDGRGALDLLRDTGRAFPDRMAQLRPVQEGALLKALSQSTPLTAVALAEAHPDLLPQDARGAEALSLLADRLAALDLPERAAALAQQALERASPEQQPALGTRLAALRLAAGDAGGALAALAATSTESGQMVERGLIAAYARARLGDAEVGLAILRDLGIPGLPALAEMLAERHDWSGASDALAAHAAAMPSQEATPRDVLRAAAFAALGGDATRLGALRTAWSARMAEGPLAQTFALLTADPVRGLSDLPRIQRELNLFRGFPNQLEAFRTAAAISR
jgi:hypothetical protein